MQNRDIFSNLSPLDHRYFLSNRELFIKLSVYLSEEGVIRYCLLTEAALVKTHIDIFFEGDSEKKNAVDDALSKITPEEVYQEEEKTKHNIRALVNTMQRYIPGEIRQYVHLGATSVDILDTSTSMRIRDAFFDVVIPLLIEVELHLCHISKQYASVPQIGRTHGQHAVPITVGYTFAEYCARLGKSIIEIRNRADDLRGKLAGAVGAYNATSLLVSDPVDLEERFLKYLNLKPSEYSTQMIEPEYMLRLLTELNTAFGIIANLADDLRNLQRSEIGEVVEFFSAKQVGSSTMPQKRNPWNSEHVKSLWKAFSPRVMTFFMDQISEHQRDLTNSASSRFISDYIAGFCAAAERMRRILEGLYVNGENCMRNITETGGSILAEAAYILLAVEGNPDGHEYVRKMTLQAQAENILLKDLLQKDDKIWESIQTGLKKIGTMTADDLFSHPELYRGRSKEKAENIADKYSQYFSSFKKETAHGN